MKKLVSLLSLAACLAVSNLAVNAAAVYSFNTSGTWTCPAGVTSVRIECWGGGGAGGAAKAFSSSNLAGGGGGGGGAYAVNTTVSVTPGNVYTVTVGAGGTSGGGASTAGTASSVMDNLATVLVTANGGAVGTSEAPGSGNAFGAGGAGGATNSSGTSYAGGAGATAVSGTGGGGGGSSAASAGAGSSGSTINGGLLVGGGSGGSGSSSSTDGGAGGYPGGGGSGAYSKSITQRSGGAGGGGEVAITVATPFAFTPGSLVVLQPADPGANNTALTILEISNNVAGQPFAFALALDGTNNVTGLRFSGSAATSGYLADSADGTLLAVTGANTNNTTIAINALAPRAVATLDPFGNYVVQTTYTATVSPTTQPRGASTLDNIHWTISDQGGMYTNGSVAPNPVGNFKAAKSFGGTNYVLTSSATVPAVMTFAGGVTNYLLGIPADANAVDFYLVSSGVNGPTYDVLYLLDNASGVGTLYKYSLSGGSWSSQGNYSLSLGGFGLCAATNLSGVNLYFTTGSPTTSNSVVVVTDAASPLNSSLNIPGGPGAVTTLYTAAAGAMLKGIAFAPVAVPPTVATAAATAIGTTNATLNGTVTYNGGAAVTNYGFYYSTSSPVTPSSTKLQISTNNYTGAYATNFLGLNANTLYYYRAYADNSVGNTLGGSDVSFYTLAYTPAAPTVASPTTTTLNVTIGSGDGNPAATTYAIKETTGGDYVQANGTLGVTAVFQTASVWGTKVVTGLNPSTTYTFAVEAQNGASVTTALGASANGTTSTPPTPTISAVPNLLNFPPTIVSGTSANLTYTASGVNLTGNITITAPANFQVSTSSGSGFGSSVTLTQSGGVVADTTIYVHFQPTAQTLYSENITDVSSGANNPGVSVTGMGAIAPSVSTQIANPTNNTSATLNGTIVATNGALLVDRGFYWSASPNVNVSTGNKLSEGGTTTGVYSKSLTGLNPNTLYYYRAYATNTVAFTLDSGDVSFYTLASTPVAPVVGGATTNSLKVGIGAGDGNPASTLYAISVTNLSEYVQANGSLNATPFFQNSNSWATITVTGLSLGASYAFAVMAENNMDIPTALGPATTAATANGPFTLGNLAVLSANNAAANNSAFTIIELNPNSTAGTAVQIVPINSTTNPTALRTSGSAGSAPKLADSGDGTLLVMAAFNSTNATVTANTITSRAVATLDVSNKFTLQTTFVGISGNQVRNATTVDNKTWYVADAGGIYTNGDTAPLNTGSIGAIKSFGGQVYVLQSSKNTVPVSTLSADGTTLTGLSGLTSRDSVAVDFCLVSSGANGPVYDILYVLDETSAMVGAINKYYLQAGTWTLSSSSATDFGGYGLAACLNNGGGVNLYVTTGDGTVAGNMAYELTDDSVWNEGPNITDQNLLYTAPGATILKGIAFAPTPPTTVNQIATGSPNTLTGHPTTFTGNGFPFSSYVWQRSTNLLAGWVNVQTNTADVNGVISGADYYDDFGNLSPTAAFYRLTW